MDYKKAQVEIMGVLIIVILIIIIIFVVIGFKMADKPRTVQKTYSNDQMSTAFLLSMLRSNTNCTGQITFEEAFKDCATKRRVNCEGDTTCVYLDDKISTIFNQTLDLWGVGYKFKANHVGFDEEFSFENNCDSNNVARVSPYSISMWPQPQPIFMNISIC
jgi:hypothetical protein